MRNWRINLILTIIFLFGAAVIGRLFFIQVLNDDFYKALAQGQVLYNIEEKIKQNRGEIFFKNGEPLAVNVEWLLVSACPKEVVDKKGTAETLSGVLSLEEKFVLDKLDADDLYVVVKRKLGEEEFEKIQELNLKGIYLKKEPGRYYPQEELASQLIGFLNTERKGQYGLEEYYDDVLEESKKASGRDIVLTIDYSIQFTAEKLLAEAKNNLDIEGGEIIVMDPVSGKILALANYPTFNPNEFSKIKDLDVFQNSATQKIFEPGSIFKPVTMASAVNEGVITPSTTYRDPGVMEIGGWPIYNYEKRTYPGDITMTQVLEKSINTGAVFAQQQLGNNDFMKYLERFGIFEPTKIDTNEIYSANEAFKKGYEINFATAAFGQGIEMTPMQLVKAYSALINGGKLVKPYIAERIVGEGETELIEPKILKENVVSAMTSSQLTAMLVSVVENGYGKPARIPNYYIAGKTGTAQVAWSALGANKAGYSDKTWQSFIGFGPAFNPQFLILVKLDNPQTKSAEQSAVPMFRELAKYIIDYYQIPPDYEQ